MVANLAAAGGLEHGPEGVCVPASPRRSQHICVASVASQAFGKCFALTGLELGSSERMAQGVTSFDADVLNLALTSGISQAVSERASQYLEAFRPWRHADGHTHSGMP